MYGMNEYQQQVRHGELDEEAGIFTTDDGKKWKSIGAIDYGNNNFFEVMVLEEKPSFDEPFRIDQYPVFLIEHGDDLDMLGTPLPEFMETLAQYDSHHVVYVVKQLGILLEKY